MSMPAPEREGYISQAQVEAETGETYYRVRIATIALGINARTFPGDRRFKYFTLEQVEQIKSWLQDH